MSQKQNGNANPYLVGAGVATGLIAAAAAAYAYFSQEKETPNTRCQPRRNWSPEAMANRTDQEECSICMEPFIGNKLVSQVPGCGHKFHSSCIAQWTRQNADSDKNCPNCRENYTD